MEFIQRGRVTYIKTVQPFYALGGVIFVLSLIGLFLWTNESDLSPVNNAPLPSAEVSVAVNFYERDASQFHHTFLSPEFIYASIEFTDKQYGSHSLLSQWVRPDGQIEEAGALDLKFPAEGSAKAYVWLRLQKENSLFSENLSHTQYAHDHYNGRWKLMNTYDGKLINESLFEVKGF